MLLIVEVADTALRYDRELKVPLYARAGIPEVWLVDLNGASISVYREPGPDGYRSVGEVRGTGLLSPQASPDVAFPLSENLGRPA